MLAGMLCVHPSDLPVASGARVSSPPWEYSQRPRCADTQGPRRERGHLALDEGGTPSLRTLPNDVNAAGIVLLVTVLLLIGNPVLADEADSPVIFAAASTTAAMTELAARFERREDKRLALSFAASSTLARQIVNGARPTLFLSANPEWMQPLREADLLADETSRKLLGNRLALIRHADNDARVDLDDPASLLAALGGSPLILGDPAHVPAGVYAREALEHFGLWRRLDGRMAFVPNARAVTARVAQGEAPLGITYVSDLHALETVVMAALFPVESHTPIRYELALVTPATNPVAVDFFDYLFSEEAQAIFQAHGFAPAAQGLRREGILPSGEGWKPSFPGGKAGREGILPSGEGWKPSFPGGKAGREGILPSEGWKPSFPRGNE